MSPRRRLPSMHRWLFLDLLPVQMIEHVAEVAHIEHLAADRAADEVVALVLRRRGPCGLPSGNITPRSAAVA